MTRFLANCEIKAHVSLQEGEPVLRYSHPAGAYSVFLRDLQIEPDGNEPRLSALITFDAPSLQDAKDEAEDCLRDFLDYLTVVTNSTFKLHRVLQVFNWEPGNGMRECIYFQPFPYHDVPIAALNQDLLETVALMQSHEVEPRLRRCLKWFRNGVIATFKDDQFIYFWLVIEILAQVVKESSPVPDKCPVCKGPLYCSVCEMSPLHKPYPKQAIQQLFEKYVKDDWETPFKQCFEVRNRLTHGEESKVIEEKLKIDLANVVDHLGRLAWTVIINLFVPGLAGKQVSFLQTNRYVHVKMTADTIMSVGFKPNFDEPKLEDFPKIDISMEIVETPGKDEKKTGSGLSGEADTEQKDAGDKNLEGGD